MYSFKGFVTIPALENRNPSQLSAVGELSARSMTFSKDIKNYPGTNGTVVVQCYSSRSTVNNNNAFTPPPVLVTKVTTVAAWVQARQLGLAGTETLADFTLAYNAQWATSLGAIDIGPMVSSGGRSFPSYLSFSVNDYTTESNIVKIWFANAAFEDQYDEYSIVIVPPLPNLASFMGAYSAVAAALAGQTPQLVAARVQAARAVNPETIYRVVNYDYFSTANPEASAIPTYWTALIYGPRGDFDDAIRAAVADHIATNSTATVNAWKAILPDIFRTTEFIMIPNWSNMAVQDRTLTAGTGSQIVNLQRELTYMRTVVSEYVASHVTNFTQVMAHPYRNILIGVIGNIQNRGNKFQITDFYPDFVSVSTTSPDFGYMSEATQGLAIHISEMLVWADTMMAFTELPAQYQKLTRNGILYISVSYQNVTYLIAARSSLPAMA